MSVTVPVPVPVPVLGLGLATEVVSTEAAIIGFSALLLALLTGASRPLLRQAGAGSTH